MASLTQAAEVSRKIIKGGVIGLFVLMIGRAVVGSAIAWWKATHPTIPPPTLGFGILPPLKFPQKESPQLTYRLETITGSLPTLQTQADVLLMTYERPNLLAMERAVAEVGGLGFKGQAEKVSDIAYRWRQTSPIPATLTMAIYDGRFVWHTEWSVDPNFLTEKNLVSQTQAVKEAQDLIRKIGESADDLLADTAQVSYLRGLSGTFAPVPSLSDADFIQVDLFRQKYKDSYPFVTSNPTQGPVSMILSGNPRSAKYVSVTYNYFAIDYQAVETYPLITTQQAWQDLVEGKGYLAQIDKGVSEAVVRRVELAYYDSFDPQHYMQPVYVFTGDNNFIGYVAAIDPSVVAQ